MAERSEIQFGTTRIPFLVQRSERRATVALTIESDGRLVVTAPGAVSIDKLNEVVRHKASWVIQLIQRIRRASERPPPPSEREFVTGETVLYLGRQYRLKVFEKAEVNQPRIWAGWYEVPIPPGLTEEDRWREVHRRLAGSLKERADLYLPDRLAGFCRDARIEKPSIIICNQHKRWGSCDVRGTLRINWRIIQAPLPLIDYVLAHLTHRTHGKAFWAELGRIMPDYEERRERRRAIGPGLSW